VKVGIFLVEGGSRSECWGARVVKVKVGIIFRSRVDVAESVGELGWLK